MNARHPLSVLAGMFIALALLWLMQTLVTGSTARHQEPAGHGPIMNFVRLHDATRVDIRKRTPPPPPRREPPPERPRISPSPQPAAPVAPRFTFEVDASSLPALGDIPAPGPATRITADRDFLPLARIPPRYPFQAQRRGVEGWVRLAFTVTARGGVEDVVVLESEPAGVFDRAAMRAVRQWKFRPRQEHGRPVAARATQVVEFRLKH